jgi:hypothetical protein
MRTVQLAELWKQVFADQGDRLMTIMATQTVWLGNFSITAGKPADVELGRGLSREQKSGLTKE